MFVVQYMMDTECKQTTSQAYNSPFMGQKIQGYSKRNRHFQRYQAFFHDVSTMSAPLTSQQLLQVLTGYAQVCPDRIRLSYWYLSCDRTFVTSSYKLTNMYYKTMLSILAKPLIILFQYKIKSVYFFYSNPVHYLLRNSKDYLWNLTTNKQTSPVYIYIHTKFLKRSILIYFQSMITSSKLSVPCKYSNHNFDCVSYITHSHASSFNWTTLPILYEEHKVLPTSHSYVTYGALYTNWPENQFAGNIIL
jgi:hypothetical protein